jgi:hypothetical protein
MEPKQQPPYPLRMPPNLRAKLEGDAHVHRRSLNAEIVARLEDVQGPRVEVETVLALRRAELDLARCDNNMAFYRHYFCVAFQLLANALQRAEEHGVKVLTEEENTRAEQAAKRYEEAYPLLDDVAPEEYKARIKEASIEYERALQAVIAHRNKPSADPWELAPTREREAPK